MLTKQLLETEKRKPNISPKFRNPEEWKGLAEKVVEAHRRGRKREEIEETIKEMETHENFKLVRGLSKLLERRSEFESRTPVDPRDLREHLFRKGPVTDEEERERARRETAEELEIPLKETEKRFRADREEEQVLTSTVKPDPETLIKQYNLSAAQTLLFDALELEFEVSGNYQQIFRSIGYLGLMYTADRDMTVKVTGPASLLKRTRKYGTSLAKLLPHIMKPEEWKVEARIETEVAGEPRIYRFKLDSTEETLFPDAEKGETSYDSDVEKEFASTLRARAEGWKIEREPTFLKAGKGVMVPDFALEKRGRKLYLEVVGFWTPEYLKGKMEKIGKVEPEAPLILAVNEDLDCEKSDFGNADEVFFYRRDIPAAPVMKRLREIEEKIVEEDVETLKREKPVPEEEKVTDLQKMAKKENVEPEALRRYVEEAFPGKISGEKYVSPPVLEEVEREINAVGGEKLAEYDPVLRKYGLGSGILEEIGYSVDWTSLDRKEVKVTEK